jgi:hypothetical protein
MLNHAEPVPSDPEYEIFGVCLGAALEEVKRGLLPDWLQQMQDVGFYDDVVKRFGLPVQARDEMVALIIAVDRCFAVPAEEVAPITQKQRRVADAHLSLALASISKLEPRLPPQFSVELVNERSEPDGSITFDALPGISAMLRENLIEYRRKLAAIRTRSGRRGSWMRWAIAQFEASINRHHPSMTTHKRGKLADELFAEVLKRHHHESRAQLRDEGDVPRTRDMVRRATAKSRSSERKTRQRKH